MFIVRKNLRHSVIVTYNYEVRDDGYAKTEKELIPRSHNDLFKIGKDAFLSEEEAKEFYYKKKTKQIKALRNKIKALETFTFTKVFIRK